MNKKTSIIMLAYKEPEKFKKMFETLIKHTHQDKTPYEIIVLINGCDEEFKKYIYSLKKHIDVICESNENLGASIGYNRGVDIAKGHYLCFFNTDYYMDDNWLETMIECFEHKPNIGLVSCCTNVSGNIYAFETSAEGVPIPDPEPIPIPDRSKNKTPLR